MEKKTTHAAVPFKPNAPCLVVLLGHFLVLFRGNINLIRALGGFSEVPYPLSNSLPDLWQFTCTEYDEDDDQDNNQFRHPYAKHEFLLLYQGNPKAFRTGSLRIIWRKCMGIEPTADVFSTRHWI